MNIGKCVFSGQDVPKSKGMYKISPDGKINLLISKKSRSLHNKKIKSQKVLWTLGSRFFHKKGSAVHKEKKEIIKMPKIIRGFPMLAKKAVEEMREKKEVQEKKSFRKSEKVSKNVNLRR